MRHFQGEQFDADLAREATRDLYAETAPQLAAAIERTIETAISLSALTDVQIACMGEGIIENVCEALREEHGEDFDAKAFIATVELTTPRYNAAQSAAKDFWAKQREARAA